ncbi:MAG: O-antigen ligase family protein [Solirubrobacteraceae bacterium]
MTVAASAPPAQTPSAPGPTPRTGAAARRLLIGLIVLCAYAAFARGATDLASETRLQVLLAALAVAAAVAWLGVASPPPTISRRALIGLGLLAGFTVWCGLSLLWSVSPSDTWVEINRAVEYTLFTGLALAVASRASAATELVTGGFLVVAVAVALYALAGKVVPWVHVGPIDLDQTAIFSRLRAPLGYWNALALVCVLAVPLALRTATDVTRRAAARLRGLLSLGLLLVVLGLTYSRGGVLALVVAVAATIWLGGPRLRGLAVFALAALAGVPALAFAFSRGPLTHDNVKLDDRVGPGLVLGLIVVLSFAALAFAGWRLLAAEARSRPDPAVTARVTGLLKRAAVAAVVVFLIVLTISSRGLFGSISHQVDAFTQTRAVPVTNPSRLLSTNSGNRWVWWKEAFGAFADQPVGGWGAGSFPVTHLLYRRPPVLPVRQPHDVPLQFLAETGIVGAVLALGALGVLLAAAIDRVRRTPPGRDRALAGACAAAGLAWLVHGLVDWDWDIPGATLPALLLIAVAAGSARPATGVRPRPRPRPKPRPSWRPWQALAGLAVVTLAITAFAASAILPSLAQSKADAALAQADAARTPADLVRAQATAELAARLNPLADEPLLDAATIADRRGLRLTARDYYLSAVRRAPYDARAWDRLAYEAVTLGDRTGLLSAVHEALAVDPIGPQSLILAATAEPYLALPQNSATSTGTPLGPAVP